MIPRHRLVSVAHVLLLGGLTLSLAAAQEPPAKDADKEFDKMLSAAKETPEKADWVKLRHAFTKTTRYQPYNSKWREELNKLRTELKGKDPKAAEAALDKLIEREGFMRLDALGLAAAHYGKTGQKEKETLYVQFARGVASTIYVPGTGMSIEKPIEVLFIEEEYGFFNSLELKAKRQGLIAHEGHKLDVFEAEANGGGEPTKFYFNVDLPQKSLGKMLERMSKKKVDE
ncbi:MAG: DUF4919 domain-containing protein [Paludisphaera borealis]|uniref:DUF4919 domain-containing protein n=1 Tax=Paludisphaera borealis TaxID=1387353 RepID=UPI0028424781|nr:DUF4919 domain-containing protein [Paludisphaera borealis]MDR3618527.1 DUF4919 domain-containing protein [Paludisphaera borealis]